MSRRGGAKPAGIQLFPFLAVLICTMGALVVLLHAFASHGRQEAEKAAQAKNRAQNEQDELDADYFRWRSTHLREARTKTQADLEAERLKLSHIEEHQRRLEEKFHQLRIAVAELEKAGNSHANEQTQNHAELARVQDELAKTRAAVDEARKKGKHEVVNYSIVPFDGRSGTHRRPIYIECCEQKIVLQPEGIELSPEDFIGYFGPGNPLAAGLRAQREYFAKLSPGGTLQEEPYPLLIVRPEGIASYYAARAALESWGSDFGYELIGADWTLSYPPSDPELKQLTATVVSEARKRLAEYIASSPQFRKGRSKPVFHAKSHGGIAQVPGTGDGPGGSFLGGWEEPENWSRGDSGTRGTGGEFASSGNDSFSGSADSSLSAYAPTGTGGGDPYAEPGTIGPQMRPGNSSATIEGRQFAEMQNGTAGGTSGPGTSLGGAEPQTGPYSSAGGPDGKFDGPAGGESVPQTRVGPATVGGGPAHARAPTGNPAARPGGQAGAESKNNYHLMAGASKSTAGGSPGSAHSATNASAADPEQSTDVPDVARHNVPESLTLDHQPNPSMLGTRTKATQSIAVTRGRGWGVSSQVGSIGATRPILVRCSADKIVIVPESRGQAANEIALGPSTEAAIDDLISGIWTQTESWGKAGRGMYWKPTLVVEVLPGGDDRFHDIQLLLSDSGLEVQRRATQQTVRPTNQR